VLVMAIFYLKNLKRRSNSPLFFLRYDETMESLRVLSRAQLKIISAVSTDLAAAGILTVFGTRDAKTLLASALFVTIMLYIANQSENIIEETV